MRLDTYMSISIRYSIYFSRTQRADFISILGRVSIEEIVRESNKLIDLNTKNRSNEAEAEPEQEQ
jgi:hypothetical protein